MRNYIDREFAKMLVQNSKRKCRRPLSRAHSGAPMSTSWLIGWSEPSLSLVCHPLIFISLTLCGRPHAPFLACSLAVHFTFCPTWLVFPFLPSSSFHPSKVLLAHNGPRSELAVGRPTAADRIGGLKRKGEGERERGITCSLGRVICVKWLSC